MSPVPVLVADLGGTSLRVALDWGDRWSDHARASTAQLDGDASAWLLQWMSSLSTRPAAACVAVAAPVMGSRLRLTNAPVWVDVDQLGIPALLTNDLAAAAMGVDLLPPQGRILLAGPPPQPDGVIAVLGVGTGLGQAVRQGSLVIPGEGGHAAFAPCSDAQRQLAAFLRQRYDYVDWEHVVSGSAMDDLLDFTTQHHPPSARVQAARDRAQAQGQGAGAVVLALAKEEPACADALDLLLGALGTEAGNLALRHLPTGGVWLVGGVAARLKPWLVGSQAFRRAFEDRGRFSGVVAQVPRLLVIDDLVGLRGAGSMARALLG